MMNSRSWKNLVINNSLVICIAATRIRTLMGLQKFVHRYFGYLLEMVHEPSEI